MPFEFDALVNKKKNHPSWRLMAADSSPLIISFLDLVFREKNLRQIREDEMKMKLDDYLFHLRDGQVEDPFPRNAAEYLEEWTTPGKDYDAPRNQDQIRKYLRWNQDAAAYPSWKDSYRMFGVS